MRASIGMSIISSKALRRNDDIECSDIDEITINGRRLEIGFIKSKAMNIFWEFISPASGK